MKYILLAFIIILSLFALNRLTDPYFQKEKRLNEILRSQELAPHFRSCSTCGYVSNEKHFKGNLCPKEINTK